MTQKIKPREKDAILQSLRVGVVPSIGLQHIQVGRKDEVTAILNDLERIENEAATIRFVIGRFGAGKSFFLNLVRMVALEKGFVVVQGDITPDRRLHASGGQARSLYTELMHNMAIRSKPNGGALASIVERFVSDIDQHVKSKGGSDLEASQAIQDRLKPLQELVSGYDFTTVLIKYF
jgi:ABC-type enterochelin transport system ATPase subunit